MDDPKRQFIILGVIGAVVAGVYLAGELARDDEPAAETAQTAGADGTEPAEDAPEADSDEGSDAPEVTAADPAAQPALTAADRAARLEQQQLFSVETDRFRAEFSNLNTGLVQFILRDERFVNDGEEMQLVTTDQEAYFPHQLEVRGVAIPADAIWTGEQVSERSVRFRWEGDGFVVTRNIRAGEGPFQLWSTIDIESRSDVTRPVRVVMHTSHYVSREEEDAGFIGRPSTAMSFGLCRWGEEDDVEREDGKELLDARGYGGNVTWTGLVDSYFSNMVVADSVAGDRCVLSAELRGGTLEEPHGTLYHATLQLPRVELGPGESNRSRILSYVGPSDREALRTAGHALPQVIDLGWFSFIADGLTEVLSAIQGVVGNWGFAIILLTLLVKLIFYPLTAKSFASMAAMRRLKPKIDAITEKYGDDREKRGQATMALYKKEKINPAAGCLPMLLQMPVWFALYRSLSTNIELYHAPFILWWTDLSAPDPYFVLPVIVAGLMFLQQQLTPNTMDPTQAKMMKFGMPLVFGAFMLFLPAGLCVYIVTNSTLSITQQRLLYARLDREAAAREEAPTPVDGEDSDDDDSTSGDLEPAAVAAGGSGSRRRLKKKKRTRR